MPVSIPECGLRRHDWLATTVLETHSVRFRVGSRSASRGSAWRDRYCMRRRFFRLGGRRFGYGVRLSRWGRRGLCYRRAIVGVFRAAPAGLGPAPAGLAIGRDTRIPGRMTLLAALLCAALAMIVFAAIDLAAFIRGGFAVKPSGPRLARKQRQGRCQSQQCTKCSDSRSAHLSLPGRNGSPR